MRTADGTPVAFVGDAQEPVELHRVSTGAPSLAEQQIQELVFEHPGVLPIRELDDSFAPAVPIGREIGTEVGPIDALYISPSGGLTIVEAKLWRNPEARREVVGQIIDYATAVSSWAYSDLDRVCRQATGTSLWTVACSQSNDEEAPSEADFIDAVSRNLRHGRFLLLVVGDGIREEVERMASYVQTAPRLQFHLALVELRIYASSDNRLRTVVPSVVARTAEITRAVVQVDVSDRAQVDVDVTVPADDSPRARRKLTMDQFHQEASSRASPAVADMARAMLEEFEDDPRFRLLSRQASIVLRLRNPAGGRDFTVLVFKTDGFVHPGWLGGQCKKAGLPERLGYDFVADLSQILDIPVHDKYPDWLDQAIEPEALREQWETVSDRIEDLAEEVRSQLE